MATSDVAIVDEEEDAAAEVAEADDSCTEVMLGMGLVGPRVEESDEVV